MVRIEVWSAGDLKRAYDLHTGDCLPVKVDGWLIALVQLRPYPFGATTIPARDYRVTLTVSGR